MNRKEILEAAAKCVCGDREQDYGSPENNFQTIAKLLDHLSVLHDEMQEPYDEHGSCCLDVLDETLNRLRCFTTSAAVEAWIRRVDNGDQ